MEKGDREKEKGRQDYGLWGRRAEQIGWGRGRWGEEEGESCITSAFSLENGAVLHCLPVFTGLPVETRGVIFYRGWAVVGVSDPSFIFAFCNSLSLKWKSLKNEDYCLGLSCSIMGEPECVLQNKLKALGGGFICMCGGEGLGVGGQRMLMCSSMSISPDGFLLAPIGAIITSQRNILSGKIWGRFFKTSVHIYLLSRGTKI